MTAHMEGHPLRVFSEGCRAYRDQFLVLDPTLSRPPVASTCCHRFPASFRKFR